MQLQLIIGILAGSLTAISATPQIFKAIRTKEVKNVSPVMFIILFLGNALWCYYGIMQEDWPIILTNAFSALAAVTMLILKKVYS